MNDTIDLDIGQANHDNDDDNDDDDDVDHQVADDNGYDDHYRPILRRNVFNLG